MEQNSQVTELTELLNQMALLKPPGGSQQRIMAITSLSVAAVQLESVLLQTMYVHLKKTQGSHKLGVVYALDSVARKWLEQAKLHGQSIGAGAPAGTFAAGVDHVVELMPSIMDDLTSAAPLDQKDKIEKLVGIWERARLLPPEMLKACQQKVAKMAPTSTTPSGSPPQDANVPASTAHIPVPSLASAPGQAPAPAPAAVPASVPAPMTGACNILEALAKISQNPAASAAMPAVPTATPVLVPAPTPAPTAAPAPAPATAPVASAVSSASAGQPMAATPVPGLDQTLAGFGLPTSAPQPGFFNQPQAYGSTMSAPTNPYMVALAAAAAANPTAQFPGFPPQPAQTSYNTNPAFTNATTGNNNNNSNSNTAPPVPGLDQTTMLLLQAMAARGITAEHFAAMMAQGSAGLNANTHQNTAPYDNRGRSERSRSRSPTRGRAFSPRGNHGGPDNQRGYRQRSPQGWRESQSPTSGQNNVELPPIPPPEQVPKDIQFDQSLLPDKIRVLSRTLFVGGVVCSEDQLRREFSRFGHVQSCVVNLEKRHAFVKMVTRLQAEAAIAGMDQLTRRGSKSFRQCRWGVGFGPRDCSDYSTGISVIPLKVLTEADVKWMLTAPYGGTGGRKLTPGMVVTEPDIEIGSGVSSKAISRRIGGVGDKPLHIKKGATPGWNAAHSNNNGGRDSDNPNNMPVAERRPAGGNTGIRNGGVGQNNVEANFPGFPMHGMYGGN